MKKIKLKLLSLILVPVFFASFASAEDDWSFIIAPYALLPSITGDTSIGVVEDAELDVGPKDILNNLELGAMIQLEALHKSGYGVSLAYNFMDLGGDATLPGSATKLSADIYQGILEAYGIYRMPTSSGPVDVYGGIRWWDMDVDFAVNGVTTSENEADWVDPVVGVRWMPQLAENWSLILKGDVGGFGVSSDFTWNLQGGVAWDVLEWLTLFAQYRALSVDYNTGAVGTEDRFKYDTITHGPMFGVAFKL